MKNIKSKKTGLPKGVHFRESTGKYLSQVGLNYNNVYLGSYDDPDQAGTAFTVAKKLKDEGSVSGAEYKSAVNKYRASIGLVPLETRKGKRVDFKHKTYKF